jgi:hypothetical protein
MEAARSSETSIDNYLQRYVLPPSSGMEAARTSETSVYNYFTRQYIPGDNSELHILILSSIYNEVSHVVSFLYVFPITILFASSQSCFKYLGIMGNFMMLCLQTEGRESDVWPWFRTVDTIPGPSRRYDYNLRQEGNNN